MIKIQNTEDNECFKWCLGRYLNPVDHNPRRNTKADRDFAVRLDFKDIKLPVKIKDIQKIGKKRITLALVFLAVKLKESIQSMHQKKCCNKKHVELLLIGEREKNTTFLSKILIGTFMMIHYIVEEKNFGVIVYMCSLQKTT